MCRLKGDEVIPGTDPVGMRKDINEYYRALGINPGADPTQIRRAYRQLVQQWHPDLFKQGSPMQTTAEDITKEINEAYEQLYRKGLYKKFRSVADKGPEAAVPPEKSPAEDPPSREAEAKKKPPPRARAKRRQDRPVNDGKTPKQPRKKRSWSLPRNSRIVSMAFWMKAAVAAAVIVVSLAVGTVAWKSVSQLPAAVAVLRHSDPASAPASSQSAAQSGYQAATSPGTGIPPRLTPTSTARIEAGAQLAAPSAAVPAEFSLVGGFQTKAFQPSDTATMFDRAEALLDVFEVGDTKAKVLAIQGVPDGAAEHVFRYGSSLVYFKDGLVRNWSDGLPHLRVRALPAFDGSLLDTFSMGSTRGDVVRAQGAPSAFTLDGYYYGSSAVYFDNDRVRGWSEGDVALKKLSMPILPFFDLDSLTFR